MWYNHKERYGNQWNRIEILKINPIIYAQVIFNKGAKTIQWGKEESLQQTMLVKLNTHMWKSEVDLRPYILYTKINCKLNKDLDVRDQTIKCL